MGLLIQEHRAEKTGVKKGTHAITPDDQDRAHIKRIVIGSGRSLRTIGYPARRVSKKYIKMV